MNLICALCEDNHTKGVVDNSVDSTYSDEKVYMSICMHTVKITVRLKTRRVVNYVVDKTYSDEKAHMSYLF